MRRLLTLLALGLAAALHAGPPSGSIDAFIAAEMPHSGAPGLAYAVVEDGTIREAGARGEARAGSGREVTPDTPFLIGSITKSFTAVAIMQLVEGGKADLGGRLGEYLPPFADRPAGRITLRQLLNHTSGYSTVQGNDAHSDLERGVDDLAGQVERIARWTPAYPPGERYEYSNANYQLLGAVIEALSGSDYASYMQANILAPIGMAHSTVADGEVNETMATGHLPWFASKRPIAGNRTDRVMAPAGGVIASANDVARYMAVMMNGEDDVISAESKALMMRPADDAVPFYGLGWFLDAENGTVSHSGATPGTETLATMIPAQRKGVVVLVNAGSGIGFGEGTELRSGITARALGLEYAGEGGRWSQKFVFASVVVLPLVFLAAMAWAWIKRDALRAKSGAFGLFSLWFPLLATIAMATVLLWLVPALFGGSMATLRLFQPDFALGLYATAITGVLWAVFRLGVTYGGKQRRAEAATGAA